jgi:hypothetical protein
MNARSWVRFVVVAALSAAVLPVLAQGSGLRVDDTSTPLAPRLQTRLGLGIANPAWAGQAGAMLGDYYFGQVRLGSGDVMAGFHATSGVLLGQRAAVLGAPGAILNSVNETWQAMPYVGIGWTSASARKGWGFSADLGLAARNSAGGLRVGSTQSLDDLLRELRMTPMLQLGVSYAF